jgi:hypothetical protein
MQRQENKGDKSAASPFGLRSCLRQSGWGPSAWLFTARVNTCPSAAVAGFYGRHEVVKFHDIPYRRYQDILYTFRAISLLLWSGGFIAAPFSLRENGHECID